MTVLNMDCVEGMRLFPDAYFDSIVTDPPYELTSARPGGRSASTEGKVMKGFMGMEWDGTGIANNVDMWREALRVLKPGGHLLAFSGSRTYHRMVCAIEDAGFEIRDQIMWVYGSGFPKSKNLDGERRGWGTALKPAHEPIVVARKSLVGTVAANVLEHGTGAINVDGCRVDGPGGAKWETPRGGIWATDATASARLVQNEQGRWPANLIHDGSDEVIAAFPQGAGRFYYAAKASKRDRDEGLEAFEVKDTAAMQGNLVSGQPLAGDGTPIATPRRANTHPTVKPTDLMRYLCRLVTPPGGTVLDPFTGSGSTGKAAKLEGFGFVGFELSAEYAAIATARISAS